MQRKLHAYTTFALSFFVAYECFLSPCGQLLLQHLNLDTFPLKTIVHPMSRLLDRQSQKFFCTEKSSQALWPIQPSINGYQGLFN